MRLGLVMPLVLAAGICMEARPQDTGGENNPRFDAYCSRTELGASVVEVQWALGSTAGADLSGLVQQQVLDVTVYKDGFVRGLYKTVKPGAPQTEFQLFKPQEGREIPGLQNLKLTQFATSQEQPKEGLHLLMSPMPGQPSAVAKLEGLEPGMKYFVRISAPGSAPKTVSFTAAICPVDYVQPKGQ